MLFLHSKQKNDYPLHSKIHHWDLPFQEAVFGLNFAKLSSVLDLDDFLLNQCQNGWVWANVKHFQESDNLKGAIKIQFHLPFTQIRQQWSTGGALTLLHARCRAVFPSLSVRLRLASVTSSTSGAQAEVFTQFSKRLAYVMQQSIRQMKYLCTEGFDSAFLSRHHQWSATRLVCSIDRCIMGQEQLDTVHMTWERCSMEGCSAGERDIFEIVLPFTVNQTLILNEVFAIWSYLPFASLQAAISEPMASSSSDAQGSWSFTLTFTEKKKSRISLTDNIQTIIKNGQDLNKENSKCLL